MRMYILNDPRKRKLILIVLAVCAVIAVTAIVIHKRNKRLREDSGIIQIFNDEPVANKLPAVVTSPATLITSTEATINGNVVSTGDAETVTAGFVYEGNVTPITTMTTTGVYSVHLDHLTCGRAYSYNAVATNSKGSVDGATRVFKTTPCSGGKATAASVKKK